VLDRHVLEGEWFAYVVIRRSALDRSKSGDAMRTDYRTGNLFDLKVAEDVKNAISEVVNARVVAAVGIPPDAAAVLTSKIPFDVHDVKATGTGAGATVAATVLPFAFTLLLFLAIVTISQALITSTLEEKSNRVIEVLLSSVSPSQLMTGKILGTCAVGLTLMTIWAAGGLSGLAMNGMTLVPGWQLLLCVVYYLLGFLLFASLMVAVGSACNTLKEAQNLLAPVMAVLSLSLIFVIAIGRDPHGSIARVLTFIPIFTPFLMMMRIAATPPAPPLEIAASIAVLGLSAWLAMRLAARVFRVGVLMYGKPPSLRELFRWMRTG
jgi:ABC-type Na+ efflux pump permease subunit